MKSYESILLELAANIIIDAAARCAANESASRDLDTLKSRFEHEGISFLTITLPRFGQDFERSLSNGAIGPENFLGFRKFRAIPAFLRGMFVQVFDADTGRIKNEPAIEAVEGIRQVAYSFKKLKLDCSPERVAKTFQGYIRDEHDLSATWSQEDISYFEDVSHLTWSWLCRCSDIELDKLVPKHGPGATAEGIYGNRKYSFRNWYSRLEPYFPLDSMAFANANAIESKEFRELAEVSEEEELPVRVITVPKTLKAPRIIAIEPVCMQYTQQAISRALVRALESHPMTAGHVNFTDQQINKELARKSSENGLMATLDLSSASDRVPAELVYRMLSMVPDFRDAIFACRSKTAKLPTGEIIQLRKFASMGSALCFPIESMYFYTLCIGALLRKRDLPVTTRNIKKVLRDVYVYGDDIIVPADDAESVVDHLQKYLCKVNMSKSFWKGNFRESCGMDAFMGKEVTPTYVREMPPNDRRNASALVSWTKTAGLLYKRGFSQSSDYMYNVVERFLGKLPVVGDECAGLGRLSHSEYYSISRWNSKLHVPEVRAWVPSPIYREDKLEGYPALLKCLLRLEEGNAGNILHPSSSDERHLQRSARYGAVTLKRRWTQPF